MKPFHLYDKKYRARVIKDDFDANVKSKERADAVMKLMMGEAGSLNNVFYEAHGYFMPQLVFTNPSLKVSNAIPGAPRHDAIGGQYALETLSKRQEWPSLWQQNVADMLAWRGVLIVTTETDSPPNYMIGRKRTTWDGQKRKIERGDEMRVPRMAYIDPNDFFIDSAAKRHNEARHMGHRWLEDLEDLKARAEAGGEGWIVAALNGLKEDDSSLRKGQVTVAQIFVPGFIDERAKENLTKRAAEAKENEFVEEYDPKLHTGTIYTVGGTTFGTEVREPRLYRGPKCGPYVLFEGPPMPFQKCGAAHYAISYPQVYNAARVDNAILDSIDDYKVVGFGSPNVIAALQKTPHNGFYEVTSAESLKEATQTVTVGGVTRELNDARMYTSSSVDRTINLSDAMRGFASKGTTATAETLADQSTDIRLSGIREQVYKAVQRALYFAYWHIDHDDTFMIDLPSVAGPALMESVQQNVREYLEEVQGGALSEEQEKRLANLDDAAAQNLPLVFVGGGALTPDNEDGTNDYAHDARSVEIEPMSMERTTEHLQQRRALQFMEVVKIAAQVAQMVPGTDLKGLVNDIGGALNLPDYGKRLGSPEDMAAMQEQQAAQTQGGGPRPMGSASLPGHQAGAQVPQR
jgi:hypothetical protein